MFEVRYRAGFTDFQNETKTFNTFEEAESYAQSLMTDCDEYLEGEIIEIKEVADFYLKMTPTFNKK